MKRYKIEFTHEQFVELLKTGVIDANTDFEVITLPDGPAAPKAAKKIVRKARRTKAQIAADKAKSDETLLNRVPDEKDERVGHNRAFQWKDPSMNTDAA